MIPTDEIRAFYHRVLPDCEKFYAQCPLNEFWGGANLVAMRNLINRERTLEGVIHGAQRTFMFSVNVEDEAERLAVAWLLAERDEAERLMGETWQILEGIEESEHTYPPLVVDVGGRRYTPDFLRCVNIAAEIREHGSIGLFTVELGGGLGHLARVMWESHTSRCHVIVDLPETLVFSYCFLRRNFPEARLLLVDDANADTLAAADYDFAFVPVAYAERALTGARPGLFLNTASMGEMRNQTVRYWMDFVQRQLRPRHLFTLNRFLNTITPQLAWRREENECSAHYDADWEILSWELEPAYTRCPYVDSRVSRYVQIIARRRAASTADAAAARERLALVAKEDWWRLRHEGHVMGMRDSPLCVDGSMNGTLFQLWNALRLCPTAQGAEMMLGFMTRLCRSSYVEFEEAAYYRNLHRRLLVEGK